MLLQPSQNIPAKHTRAISFSFTLSLGVILQQGCVGDGNAGWTDPLHHRYIDTTYAGAIINVLCLF